MKLIKIFLLLFQLVIFSCTKNVIQDIGQITTVGKILFVSSRVGLKIREKPSKEGAIINILPYGMFIEVMERTNDREIVDGINDYWYKIEYNNKNAWIFGGYLTEKIKSSPIVGKWKSIHDNKQIWLFYFDNRILAGTESTDHVFYDGTYELLGNKLYIITKNYIDYETEEYEILEATIIIEFVNIDKMILYLENGIIFELIRY
jgi:hypothetical protein